MSTDPFVAARRDRAPRQEPNLAPGTSLPPRRPGGWWADRPGDLHGVQPTGDMLGSPGPNLGYALTLARRAAPGMTLHPAEHLDDAVALVAETAMRRSASYGRAPTSVDVDCATVLLGYRGGCEADFAQWRAGAGAGAAHDYACRRELGDAVDLEVLRLGPSELGTRAGAARSVLAGAVGRPDAG